MKALGAAGWQPLHCPLPPWLSTAKAGPASCPFLQLPHRHNLPAPIYSPCGTRITSSRAAQWLGSPCCSGQCLLSNSQQQHSKRTSEIVVVKRAQQFVPAAVALEGLELTPSFPKPAAGLTTSGYQTGEGYSKAWSGFQWCYFVLHTRPLGPGVFAQRLFHLPLN